MAGEGTAGGSLIGMLVGVLGGPVGMLLGWRAGAAGGRCMTRIGSTRVMRRSNSSAPRCLRAALLADTVEDTTEPLDKFVSAMGGTIMRRPLDEVVTELEAQQDAAEEADKAARKAIREQKKQERNGTRQQRLDALKAKFHKQ